MLVAHVSRSCPGHVAAGSDRSAIVILPRPRRELLQTPEADYRFRVSATREAWAGYVASAAEDIDYDNFKAAVAVRNGAHRAHAYGDVWAVMRDLQESSRFRRRVGSPRGRRRAVDRAAPRLTGDLARVRLRAGIGRFEEVARLLARRYGRRLVELRPTQRSRTYLFGDRINAIDRDTDVNRALRDGTLADDRGERPIISLLKRAV